MSQLEQKKKPANVVAAGMVAPGVVAPPPTNIGQAISTPSESWRRRLLGNPVSEKTATQWPELARSWLGREIEMPNQTAATNSVRPMNFVEKMIMPDAAAATYPWGTIALNRGQIEKNQVDLGDTLVHELTHVGQNQKTNMFQKGVNNIKNLFTSYSDKNTEKEAFDAQYSRPVRRFDISLLNKTIDPNIQVPTVNIPNQSSGASGSWMKPTGSIEQRAFEQKPIPWSERIPKIKKLKAFALD